MLTKTTIYETQRGLMVMNGKIVRELGPGVYRTFKRSSREFFIYPKTAQAYVVPNNCRSKDSASFIVDVPTMISIVDIRTYFLSSVTYYQEVARVCTKHIQEITGTLTLAEILAEPLKLDGATLNEELAKCGLAITIEGPIETRLPRNLQNAIDAQEVARQKAKAEIEEARGRTAVLRHYANAAKLTKDNPDVLRLLLGQKAKSINVAFDARN